MTGVPRASRGRPTAQRVAVVGLVGLDALGIAPAHPAVGIGQAPASPLARLVFPTAEPHATTDALAASIPWGLESTCENHFSSRCYIGNGSYGKSDKRDLTKGGIVSARNTSQEDLRLPMPSPTVQTWDPANYARHARFVSDLGSPVVDLLAPKPGERILDLGCGDGALTKKLVDLGCRVVAVDSSIPQVEAARSLGLDAHVIAGEALPYQNEFDAVFSNAVLHWIKDADQMIAGVYRSIRAGGRFVAECGGHGCVQKIRTALVQALDRRGLDGEARVPWYFPTPGDYATRLERAGFRVDTIALIPRPTPLPGDIIGYLETFAQNFFKGLSEPERAEYLQEVRAALEPQLRDGNGIWIADYVRLRFAATKPPAAI